MQKLLENLAATAELMGQAISPVALSMIAKDLQQYPTDTVIEALGLLRRESKGKFSLAGVIEKIERLNPDVRPSADEAWAMIPRDEATSVVMTDEMAEAMGIAQPLLDEGDQVAARMAFKSAYDRITDTNKRAGVAFKWFASLGYDKEGRAPVLADAIRLGRIGVDHAIGLVAPDKVADMLQISGHAHLALEHKLPASEAALANIERIKAMINAAPTPEE